MLSVLVPSNRIGGLDVLFNSLENQSNKNFELVLIDALWKYRHNLVREKAKGYSFEVKHIEPRDNPFPDVCYCRTMNTGVVASRGDTLLYTCDYSWFGPDVVEAHLDFAKRGGKPLALDFAYTVLPELSPHFVPFVHAVDPTEDPQRHTDSLNKSTEAYVTALDRGDLDWAMWSIFREEARDHEKIWKLPLTNAHYRQLQEAPLNDYNYCAFKNESFPAELILDMNGHDEDYDRSHGWQDSEFAYRSREDGVVWWSGPRARGEVRCLNPREILNIKHMPDPWLTNRHLCYELKPASKRLPVNPHLNLMEMRCASKS